MDTKKVTDSGTVRKDKTEVKYYMAAGRRIAMRTITSSTDTLHWLISDHLSSTTIITDESGTIISEMKYTAFGEISGERKRNTNRIDIISNLHTDPENVMMIGFTLPVLKGVGHWVDVIGFDPDTDEIMFFNPAKEEDWRRDWKR